MDFDATAANPATTGQARTKGSAILELTPALPMLSAARGGIGERQSHDPPPQDDDDRIGHCNSPSALLIDLAWTTIPFNQRCQPRIDRHALEHVNVAATGVSLRHYACKRAKRAQDHAHGLAASVCIPTPLASNTQHHPVRPAMRQHMVLPQYMGGFEVAHATVQLSHQNAATGYCHFSQECRLQFKVHDWIFPGVRPEPHGMLRSCSFAFSLILSN
jgi:hypothetical protein